MTKSDLIQSVSLANGWARKDVEDAVNTMFVAMTDALSKGERIEIRGLGSFRVKERKPREGRNPKTGDLVSIPARRIPYFTVGKALRERVDELRTGRIYA